MKPLLKEDVLESILADRGLMAAIERYDPRAEPVVLRATPRKQAKGQSWASHAILVKNDENILFRYQVIGCHQNLGGKAGSNTFDYWSIGFASLDAAAEAFCDVQNFNTEYLAEVKFDAHRGVFKHVPDPGRIDFELAVSATKPREVIELGCS